MDDGHDRDAVHHRHHRDAVHDRDDPALTQAAQDASPSTAFVALRDFWGYFMRAQPGSSPATPESVAQHLDNFFGQLTQHHFRDIHRLPIISVCTDCRNNVSNRRKSVCETHVGAIQGCLERLTGVPLRARYTPTLGQECTIELDIQQTDNGDALIPWARKAANITTRNSGGRGVVEDRRTGNHAVIQDEILVLLDGLDRVMNADELAGKIGMSSEQTRALLDECYRAGWVECAFAPAGERPNGILLDEEDI
jgi:hypothetical protein